MNIELLTEDREDEYNHFLLKSKDSFLLNTLKYRDLLEWITKAKSMYLVALENNEIIGALPTFLKENKKFGNVLNSLPWYGSNPGIIIDPSIKNKDSVKHNLFNVFKYLAEDNKCVTSTMISRPFENIWNMFKYYNFRFLDSRAGMFTDLPVGSNKIEDDLMEIYHSKTRNLVRKAMKNDIVITHSAEKINIEFLADLHKRNMEAVNAPPKGLDFFNKISEIFSYDQDYRIYIARKDGVNIGALLVLYFNNTVEYYTPAVEVDYRTYQPLNLLIFEAMKDMTKMGYTYWNWGGTIPETMAGVYHFKKRWGSRESTYYYFINSYNDEKLEKILGQNKNTIIEEYPHFYVVPFDNLKGGNHDQRRITFFDNQKRS